MYVRCDGNLTQATNGTIRCDTSWVSLTPEQVLADIQSTQLLDAADYQVLFGGAVLMLVIGFGIRMVRRIFEERPGRG